MLEFCLSVDLLACASYLHVDQTNTSSSSGKPLHYVPHLEGCLKRASDVGIRQAGLLWQSCIGKPMGLLVIVRL